MNIRQEFTYISTPQENAYIESFHSNLEREVIQRFVFSSFYEAKQTIAGYMDYYNNHRLHSLLNRMSPMSKWNEYFNSLSSDMQPTAQVSEGM